MIPWLLAGLVYSDLAYQGYRFYTKKSTFPSVSGNVKKQISSTRTHKFHYGSIGGGRYL